MPNISDVEAESRTVKHIGAKTFAIVCIEKWFTIPEHSCRPLSLLFFFKDCGCFYSVAGSFVRNRGFINQDFVPAIAAIFQAQNKLTEIQYLTDFNLSICILTN